jgi:hypothetical protein
MVESVSAFPLSKLRYDKFLTLDVMMYLEYQEANTFMFAVNKEARLFLQNNFIIIRNGFLNDGLIIYRMENHFNSIYMLEKLYFSALKRKIGNRNLTISINIDRYH